MPDEPDISAEDIEEEDPIDPELELPDDLADEGTDIDDDEIQDDSGYLEDVAVFAHLDDDERPREDSTEFPELEGVS